MAANTFLKNVIKEAAAIVLAIVVSTASLLYMAGCNTSGENSGITDDYQIVYAANDMQARSAANRISTLYREQTGDSLTVTSDSAPEADKEIVIGAASGRKYSYCAPRLAKDGWYVGVLGDDVYIQSATGNYTEAAAAFDEYFLKNSFGPDTSVGVWGDYAIDTLTINGMSVALYDIFYKDGSERARLAANDIRDWLEKNTGYRLSVSAFSEREKGVPAFCVGVADESGADTEDVGYDEYTAVFKEGFVGIVPEDGILTDEKYYEDCINSFLTRYFGTGEDNISVEETGTKVLKCWEYLDSRYTETEAGGKQNLAEGVTWKKSVFTGTDGVVTAFVLEAAAGAGWELQIATAPGYTREKPIVATVLDTAEALRKEGEDVLFACNSGFFRANDNNHPEGVLIVEGEVLSYYGGDHLGGNEQCFFGITESGGYVIGDREKLNDVADSLVYAAGGRGILLKDGELCDICYAESDRLGEVAHPRTLLGVRKDGGIVIIVADGRRGGYSDGLDLCDAALLLKSYGASDAINFDGGGSSTFVVKGENGALSVQNRPSDGALRKVGDCLVLSAA